MSTSSSSVSGSAPVASFASSSSSSSSSHLVASARVIASAAQQVFDGDFPVPAAAAPAALVFVGSISQQKAVFYKALSKLEQAYESNKATKLSKALEKFQQKIQNEHLSGFLDQDAESRDLVAKFSRKIKALQDKTEFSPLADPYDSQLSLEDKAIFYGALTALERVVESSSDLGELQKALATYHDEIGSCNAEAVWDEQEELGMERPEYQLSQTAKRMARKKIEALKRTQSHQPVAAAAAAPDESQGIRSRNDKAFQRAIARLEQALDQAPDIENLEMDVAQFYGAISELSGDYENQFNQMALKSKVQSKMRQFTQSHGVFPQSVASAAAAPVENQAMSSKNDKTFQRAVGDLQKALDAAIDAEVLDQAIEVFYMEAGGLPESYLQQFDQMPIKDLVNEKRDQLAQLPRVSRQERPQATAKIQELRESLRKLRRSCYESRKQMEEQRKKLLAETGSAFPSEVNAPAPAWTLSLSSVEAIMTIPVIPPAARKQRGLNPSLESRGLVCDQRRKPVRPFRVLDDRVNQDKISQLSVLFEKNLA